MKTRKTWPARNAVAGHDPLQFVKRIARRFKGADLPVFSHCHGLVPGGNHEPSARAEERIASDLIALLGGFEQKRRRLSANLCKGGNRRVTIGNDLRPDRNNIRRCRLLHEDGARRIQWNHVKDAFGVALSEAFWIRKSSAAAKLNMLAMILAGKTSRCVL